MSDMCAPDGNQTDRLDSVHIGMNSELYKAKFYFVLLLVFLCFCPSLGVPPGVCYTKIAQLLLHRVELNSAAHCVVMGGRGMNRP